MPKKKLAFTAKTMGDYQQKIAKKRGRQHFEASKQHSSPVTVIKFGDSENPIAVETVEPVFVRVPVRKRKTKVPRASKSLL